MELMRGNAEFAIFLVAAYALSTRARGRLGINIGCQQPFGLFLATAPLVGAA